jgi:hypothetical protein
LKHQMEWQSAEERLNKVSDWRDLVPDKIGDLGVIKFNIFS